jgi:hypothetical protein
MSETACPEQAAACPEQAAVPPAESAADTSPADKRAEAGLCQKFTNTKYHIKDATFHYHDFSQNMLLFCQPILWRIQDLEVPLAENDDKKPSVARAKYYYAKVNGISEISQVTGEMLINTDRGVEGWACYGIDSKARGPMGNQMYRQIKKNPKANEAYRWLFDDLKKKFRQTWSMTRTFDFIRTKRVHTISTKTKQTEIGQFKNQLQLEAHFGGVGHPEAKRQADNYVMNCRRFKARFSSNLFTSERHFFKQPQKSMKGAPS